MFESRLPNMYYCPVAFGVYIADGNVSVIESADVIVSMFESVDGNVSVYERLSMIMWVHTRAIHNGI